MKRLIVILLLIGTTGICNAQVFGVKGGMNMSNLMGDIDTATFKIGFQAGVVAEFELAEKIFLQPELLFTLQGAIDNEQAEEKISLNYVSLPVMAKIFLSSGFNVQFGPRVGLLVMAQATHDEIDVQIEDKLAQIDMGLNFGIGYQKGKWGAEARYYQGLIDLEDQDDTRSVKNQGLEFSITYLINKMVDRNPMKRKR